MFFTNTYCQNSTHTTWTHARIHTPPPPPPPPTHTDSHMRARAQTHTHTRLQNKRVSCHNFLTFRPYFFTLKSYPCTLQSVAPCLRMKYEIRKLFQRTIINLKLNPNETISERRICLRITHTHTHARTHTNTHQRTHARTLPSPAVDQNWTLPTCLLHSLFSKNGRRKKEKKCKEKKKRKKKKKLRKRKGGGGGGGRRKKGKKGNNKQNKKTKTKRKKKG